jgi:hypothetical protein
MSAASPLPYRFRSGGNQPDARGRILEESRMGAGKCKRYQEGIGMSFQKKAQGKAVLIICFYYYIL